MKIAAALASVGTKGVEVFVPVIYVSPGYYVMYSVSACRS